MCAEQQRDTLHKSSSRKITNESLNIGIKLKVVSPLFTSYTHVECVFNLILIFVFFLNFIGLITNTVLIISSILFHKSNKFVSISD